MADVQNVVGMPHKWSVIDTQTNATATATKAAAAGRRHYITGFSFSGSAAPAAAVTVLIKRGTTNLDRYEIPANAFSPLIVDFKRPFECAINELAQATVGALGAGVVGTITIRGYTEMA